MENAEPDSKATLIALMEAVTEIDGGCSTCINGFCETATESLRKIGSPYEIYYWERKELDDNPSVQLFCGNQLVHWEPV